jgi:hypothetical protein
MSEFHERIRFLDYRLLEDTPREIVSLAARILRYERYLDHLELTKDKQGSLPSGVEISAGRSIQRTLADIKAAGNLILELIDELELTGALPHLVPHLAGRLQSIVVTPSSLFSEHGSFLEGWLAERGMPVELWRWAMKCLDLNGYTAVAHELSLQVLRDGKSLGMIVTADGLRFDAASILGLPSRKKPVSVDAASVVRMAVQTFSTLYERRARMTATEGVQVFPTGFWPILIIVIVAFAVFVAGLVISVLCLNRVITDSTTCEIGLAFLICGLLGFLVAAGTGPQQEGDPTDPGTSIPDPPG